MNTKKIRLLKRDLTGDNKNVGDLLSGLKTDISPVNKGFSVEGYEEHLIQRDLTLNDYILNQKFITSEMRKVLVNWMLKLQNSFLLKPETYFTAVRILDAFSGTSIISRTNYNLVGLTALFMAAKSVEITDEHPNIGRFAYIANNLYTTEKIRKMERFILKRLNYNFNIPTIFQFLMMYTKTFGFNNTQVSYSIYLATIATYIYKLARIKQRHVALTCIYMTMKKFKLLPQIVDKYYIKYIHDMIVSERSRMISLIDNPKEDGVGEYLIIVFSTFIYRKASLFDLNEEQRKKITNSQQRKELESRLKNELKRIDDIVIRPLKLIKDLNIKVTDIEDLGGPSMNIKRSEAIDKYKLAKYYRKRAKTEGGPQWMVNFQKHGYFNKLTPEVDRQLPISVIRTPPMREFENPYTPTGPFVPKFSPEPEFYKKIFKEKVKIDLLEKLSALSLDPPNEQKYTKSELKKNTVVQLRVIAKNIGIKRYYKFRKADLVNEIIAKS